MFVVFYFRYANVSLYNGKFYLHLCYFRNSQPLSRVVANRIALSEYQTKSLFQLMDKVTEITQKTTLGYDKFVSKEEEGYLLARYEKAANETVIPHPTDRMELTNAEWMRLREIRADIEQNMPTLNHIRLCDCGNQGNQLETLQCRRCNYFDAEDWK